MLLHDETGGRIELYDVIQDRAQEKDLAAARPERVRELKAKINTWRQSLPPFQQSPTRGKGAPVARAIPTQDRVVIFKRWDKNADGQLSLDEYTSGLAKKEDAPRRFKSFDLNGDGKISVDEFAPAR